MFKHTLFRILTLLLALGCGFSAAAQNPARGHHGHRPLSVLSGRVVAADSTAVGFATVYLKDTNYGCSTDDKGIYHLKAPAGTYELVVSAVGFEPYKSRVTIGRDGRNRYTVVLKPSVTEVEEVVVTGSGVSRIRRSPFNAVALDTKELQNSTKSLSEALSQLPGMKLRESGGVGSDMQLKLEP